MNTLLRSARNACVLALPLLVALSGAQAQDFPSRPIRLVVPYGAGGSSDGPMRVIAQEVSRQIGHQIVVENKPGQGAMLGSADVVKAPADGYTLLLASNPNAISASLYGKLTFNPIDDFAPITLLGREQAVLLVHPSFPVKTVKEFVAYVKANPDKVNYGSSGNGSAQHLFMALMMSMGELKMTHVPYKSSGGVTTDLLGGQIQTAMPGLAAMVSHVKEGKLRAIAVSGAQRSPLLPDVPTLAESGFKGYEAYIWMGILAPKGTPAPIIDKLNRELNASLKAPAVKAYMNNAAIEQIGSTPAEFGSFFKGDRDLWARIIKEIGAKVD
jgi:tripartite-type tricarboxylate transporter receptor subunit TctC